MAAKENSAEDAALEAYLAGAGAQGHIPNQVERKGWLEKRYIEIKGFWLLCMLQKWEAEGIQSESNVGIVLQNITGNFKERAWVVRELREVGEVVNDPFSDLLEKEGEEAAVHAYAEGLHAGVETPKESDYREYSKVRYEQIKKAYKELLLGKSEAQALKNAQATEGISAKLRINFKQRLWVVKNMRRMGVPIEDPFVPNAAV